MTDTPPSEAPSVLATLPADPTCGIAPAHWDTLDTDTLIDLGPVLSARVQTDKWVLGDYACALVDRMGPREALAQLIADGHDPADIGKTMAVAVAVPHDIRRRDLTWSHHNEVRRQTPDDQVAWLQRAARCGWSARALRQAIRAEDEANRLPLDGMGPLPRPSERLLRRALESGAQAVLWDPEGGSLGAAAVRDVKVAGQRAIVVLEVDAGVAASFEVDRRAA